MRKASHPLKQTVKKYALLSVFDKTGIVDFAKTLKKAGYEIISTGGTAGILTAENVPVIPISEITGNPESFDGRMKTISFEIESGILYDRTSAKHRKEAKELDIKPIDVVVCNLYPFEKTISDKDVDIDDAIESIDVGGPTMIRSAAKNFKCVTVVVNPKDYEMVGSKLGNLDIKVKQELAAKAFNHLSFYDSQIGNYLSKQAFPIEKTLPGRLGINLRYGENPHQKSVVYFEPHNNSPMQHLVKQTGRELSYVNFTDIAAGLESVRIFKEPAAVVIKHNSPSGIALGSDSTQALQRAVEADPESAFGGVMVLNSPLDLKTAETFAAFKEENGVLIDIVAAPTITPDAMEFIKGVRKTTGIYTFGKIPKKRSNPLHMRYFDGGYVLQDWDDTFDTKNWKVVTNKKPTDKQMEQARLGWKFTSRIKSNTILVIDKDLPMTRGIGSGQTSRIRSAKIALEQAGTHVKDGILISDSFFPFDDSVKLAAKAGISCILQQGGSVRDNLSIEAANEAGISMILTGERKFWH